MEKEILGTVTPEMISRMRRCPCERCSKEAIEMEEHLLKSRKIMEAVNLFMVNEENDKT